MTSVLIVGYDPGGDGRHGLALLSLRDGKPTSIETHTCQTCEHVLTSVEGLGAVAAFGVDTLTCWSTVAADGARLIDGCVSGTGTSGTA